ncbi:MAG: membrane-bound lytic murein transglycosylase F, partial [Enterobacterales bacterium]
VDVKERLPLLRQKKYYKNTRYGYARGNEPVQYVDNIRRYYETLQWISDETDFENGNENEATKQLVAVETVPLVKKATNTAIEKQSAEKAQTEND